MKQIPDAAVQDMPERIYAKTHGASTDVISGQRGLIGGWNEHKREGQVEFIRSDVATLTHEGTKPVDAAAVRDKANEWLVKWYGSEPMKGASIWSATKYGLYGDNLFHIGRDREHLELARNIADAHNSAIRALSAEPVEGEQWRIGIDRLPTLAEAQQAAMVLRACNGTDLGEWTNDIFPCDDMDYGLEALINATPNTEEGR